MRFLKVRNYYIFLQKGEKDGPVLFSFFFANLLNLCFIRRQLDSHICFHIQFVLIYCFGWIVERTFGLPQIFSWTSKSFLVVFSVNYRYSSLTLPQNSVGGSLLKVTCSEESELAMNFILLIKTYQCICTLNGSFIPARFCNLMHWSFRKYWFMELWIFQMLKNFFNTVSKQSHSLMSLLISQKPVSTEKLAGSKWQI